MDIAETSTEYVHVPVKATIAGTSITPGAPPKLAFLDRQNTSNPDSGDWITGEWSGGNARLLVGPNGGTTTLAIGTYRLWITFAAGLETPVYRVGTVTVY